MFGLPLIGFLIIVRAGSEKLKEKTYILRYGLLFAGYREGREWWEVVIVLRKIAIVSVGIVECFFSWHNYYGIYYFLSNQSMVYPHYNYGLLVVCVIVNQAIHRQRK